MRTRFLCIALFIAHATVAQNILDIQTTPSAAQPSDSARSTLTSQTPGNGKKPHRFGFALGGSNQRIPEYADFPEYELNEFVTVALLKIYYERFHTSSAGLGLSMDAFGEFENYERDSKNNIANIYYGWKLYISGYAFKDFDIGNAFTVGVSGGPAAVLNIVYADPEENEYVGTATSTGVGLHFGQYILKYLSKNDKNQKSFFLRMGFDQYVATHTGFSGGFYVALGF